MALASEETARGSNRRNVVFELLNGVEATSPAAAGYSRSTDIQGFTKYSRDPIWVIATLQGATGGVLDVVVEISPDGTDWYEWIHFTQLAAAAAQTVITCIPDVVAALAAVGKNLTTTFVLAAGQVRGRPGFDHVRVRMVAGTGTSVGATQSVKLVCVDCGG
jgi:hypothetical protein